MAVLSPFSNLFLAIQERLAAISELRFVDQDFGQLQADRPPVAFPCALIDFVSWSYENLSDGLQKGQGNVVITLGATPYSNSFNASPLNVKEKALAYYELEYLIFKALHNWAPPGFEPLIRLADDKEESDTNLRQRIIIFQTGFTDLGAQAVRTIRARPDPIINADAVRV